MAGEQPQIVVVDASQGESVPGAMPPTHESCPRGILKKRERKRNVAIEA